MIILLNLLYYIGYDIHKWKIILCEFDYDVMTLKHFSNNWPFVRGESTSHQCILQTNVSEMWSFGASFVSLTEQYVEQSSQAPIIWTKWASYQTHKIAACAENAGNIFPVTVGWRYRHASRHVRDACAVMHAGIAS